MFRSYQPSCPSGLMPAVRALYIDLWFISREGEWGTYSEKGIIGKASFPRQGPYHSPVCLWKLMNQYRKHSNGSSVFEAIQIYSWLQTSNELLWNWKDLQLGKKTMQRTAWSPLLLPAWLASRIISWWQCDSPSSNYEALSFSATFNVPVTSWSK